jgi:Protein of unknown function (DUF3592)
MNWFLIIVFGILPLIGALFAVRTILLIRHGVRVAGAIIDYEVVESSNGRTSTTAHYPIVRFTGTGGKVHTVKMTLSSPATTGKLGAVVKIIYPYAKPQAAQIERFSSLWFFPLFFCGPTLAAGAFVGGHYVWWRFFV